MSAAHNAVALPGRAEVEDFLFLEARLLDERRFEEWLELFTADGIYWAPARPEQSDPQHEVSLFHDDGPLRAARVRRLRHPRVYAELPASRAVRAVSNVEVTGWEDGGVAVRSVLTMTEFRPGAALRTFTARLKWRLQPAPWRIRLKRVDLVDADGMHAAMTVPF